MNEEIRDLRLAGTLLFSIRDILAEAETLVCEDDVLYQLIRKLREDARRCRNLCVSHADRLERRINNARS